MDMTKYKRVFEESKLTKDELGYIYQVSRQTVYAWYREDAEPKQGGIKTRFATYTDALIRALDKKVLPLAANLTKDIRRGRLLSIATQLHSLIKPTQPK